MTYVINHSEYCEIDGVPLNTPAWTHTNLFELWSGPTTRGTDRIIPGAAGALPYRRRATVRTVTLELVVYGDLAWDGTTYADARTGLFTNVGHLRTNVTDPTGIGDGTRTMILHLPDGSTRSGDIHVEGFALGGGLGPFHTLATIDISILAGALAVDVAST
jgi:hypothetical protein